MTEICVQQRRRRRTNREQNFELTKAKEFRRARERNMDTASGRERVLPRSGLCNDNDDESKETT